MIYGNISDANQPIREAHHRHCRAVISKYIFPFNMVCKARIRVVVGVRTASDA